MRPDSDAGERYAYRSSGRPSFPRRFASTVLLLVCGALVYTHAVGIPRWVVRLMREELAEAGLAFEASTVRLDVRRGVVLADARLFRVGVIGPPAAEARNIVLGLDVFSFLRQESALSSVMISDGCLRPSMLCEREPEQAESRRVGRGGVPAKVRVTLERSEVLGIGVERLTFLLEDRGNTLACREVTGRLRRGDMAGDVSGSLSCNMATCVLDAHFETQFDPHLVLPVFEYFELPVTARLIRRFDFGSTPPRCEFNIHSEFGDSSSTALDGSFWFRDTSYEGVELLRGDGSLHVTMAGPSCVVVVDPLFLVRPEGMARGGFTLDYDRDMVEFHARSALHPAALSRLIGVATNEVAEWTFDGPVSMSAEGAADLTGWERMDFTMEVAGRKWGYSNLVAESCSCEAVFNGPTITVSDVKGVLFDGELEGEARFVAPVGDATNTLYSYKASLYRADFEQVARLLAGEQEDEYQGRFTMLLNASGHMGEDYAEVMVGSGRLGVDDGRVFMLPVFGGLSKYMTKIIPGLDFVLKQTDASTEFTIAGGRVRSEEINIKGDVLSLGGKGAYRFDRELEFEVQIRLLKSHTIGGRILRPLFYPLSKLFEFRLRGTMDAPDWYLINFSRDVLEKLGLKNKEN